MSTFKLPSRVTLVVHLVVAFAFWAAVSASGCSSSNNGSSPDASADSSMSNGETSLQDKTTNNCTGSQTSCSGTCVNTASDPKNCGTCGATCGGGLVCSSGKCAVGCTTGQTLCGTGTCADLQTDFDNCGACGMACQAGQVCNAGKCGSFCGAPNTVCSGSCVNTTNDANNCGTCGNICGTGLVCSGSKCVGSCGTLTACVTDGGSFCTNPQTDNTNCGTCGNVCPGGQFCSQGQCSVTCGGGTVECAGKCVDPTTDPTYCGATTGCGVGGTGSAGKTCATGQACGGGICAISCPAGQVACGGTCIDPQSNGSHCGAAPGCGVGDAGSAGTLCGAGLVCSSGSCQANCGGGLVLCSVSGTPTCVDPNSSPSFCGATNGCGVADAGSPGSVCPAGQFCAGGTCGTSCQAGYLACSGVCIDPTSDPNHCGAIMGSDCMGINMGKVCPQGNVCVNGSCTVSCVTGEIDCHNQCVDPLSNNQNCGAMGLTCQGGVSCATGTVCEAGVCNLTCQMGFINCFGNCINPTNNNSYCGVNAACSTNPNGSCADGGGACSCPTGKVCSASVCGISCLGSEALCGTPPSCINPQTDSNYCGATAGSATCAGATNCPTTLVGSACLNGGCACPPGSGGQPEAKCVPGPGLPPVCTDGFTSNATCGATGTCSSATPGANFQGYNCSGTPAQGGITGSSCVSGACTCPNIPAAPAGNPEPVCGGPTTPTCIDPGTNDKYCGAKGTCTGTDSTQTNFAGVDCTQMAGSSCVAGVCTCPKNVAGTVTEVSCPTGGSPPFQCVDQSVDNGFCNAGGQNCTPDFPTGCCTGRITCGKLTQCGPDLKNPGKYACNNTCDPLNQIQCTAASPPSCENFKTDNSNCGTCGTTCNAPETCQKTGNVGMDPINNPANYTCALTCPTGAGWTECPGTPPYCANVLTDSNNCNSAGGCGHPCTNGSQLCSNGTCANTCQSPPDTLCSAAVAPNPTNPYCADFTTDINNCGACGTGGYGTPHDCLTSSSDTSHVCIATGDSSFAKCCPKPDNAVCSGNCTDTTADINHCANCTTACTGTDHCMGSTCGTHIDGLGDNFWDTTPASTYNVTEAMTACKTWASAHGQTPASCTDFPSCASSVGTVCYCPTAADAFVYFPNVTSSTYYFWFYAGSLNANVDTYTFTASPVTCTPTSTWH